LTNISGQVLNDGVSARALRRLLHGLRQHPSARGSWTADQAGEGPWRCSRGQPDDL